jgi:hypothetical protein
MKNPMNNFPKKDQSKTTPPVNKVYERKPCGFCGAVRNKFYEWREHLGRGL